MATPQERDFPLGHPKSSDYDPGSADAIEWARKNIHPLGERDFPVDHPKAVDTAGNTNHLAILPGLDPGDPELEEHTGRKPAQVEGARKAYLAQLPKVKETPASTPVIAANPPVEVARARAMAHRESGGAVIWCPACDEPHLFDMRWTWNGSLELPTFTSSMVVHADDPAKRCHSIVTNGSIAYAEDCGHRLRGQTIVLPIFPLG